MKVLSWYHHYLQHPGTDRMEGTIGSIMYWHGMSQQIRKMCKTCPRCQQAKGRKREYGHVPPKEAVILPWHTLHCDLIGPVEVRAKDGTVMDFMCLTMIDAATGWFEIVELPTRLRVTVDEKTGRTTEEEIIDRTSATVSKLLNNLGCLAILAQNTWCVIMALNSNCIWKICANNTRLNVSRQQARIRKLMRFWR
eukprot:scaffold14781_cov97-Skeletonema_dohrnii-CCMP3373.AAC.1